MIYNKFAYVFWKFSTIFSTSDPTSVAKEAFGLSLAIAGLAISLQTNPPNWIVMCALGLAGIGLSTTLINKDIYDRLPVAPLKNIEETISLLIFFHAIASVGSDYNE